MNFQSSQVIVAKNVGSASGGLEDFYFTSYINALPKIDKDNIMNDTKKFGFDIAILHLKNGKKVAREGWNGKSMFIFAGLPKVSINPEIFNGSGYITNQDASDTYGVPYSGLVLCMKTAQDTIVVGWLASQTDLLCEDYILV